MAGLLRSADLTCLAGVFDLAAQIAEVIGIHREAEHFVDDRKKVGQ